VPFCSPPSSDLGSSEPFFGNDVRSKYCQRLTIVFVLFAGCSAGNTQLSSWHAKHGWDAGVYFEDPLVIELCQAIERRDVAAVRRLIAQGANVNATGKDQMTPLMWAFPEENTAVFEELLRAGADPDVAVESDLNTGQAIQAGDSVTVLPAESGFDYLTLVLQHGGDANARNAEGAPLLHLVIGGAGANKQQRVQLLLDAGADIDGIAGNGTTAVMRAVNWGAQFDLAMFLLQAGADWTQYKQDSHLKLVHYLVQYEDSSLPPQQESRLESLLQFLEAQGEDLDKARADVKRWNKELVTMTGAEFARRRQKEVEERKQSEARETASAGDVAK
jgi:ankyrin repeat protein